MPLLGEPVAKDVILVPCGMGATCSRTMWPFDVSKKVIFPSSVNREPYLVLFLHGKDAESADPVGPGMGIGDPFRRYGQGGRVG